MSKCKNWVTDILDAATRTVEAWPEWMRRPEVRGAVPEQPKEVLSDTKDLIDRLLCETASLRGSLVAQKQKFKSRIQELEACLQRRHDESRELKEQRKGLIKAIDELEAKSNYFEGQVEELTGSLNSLEDQLYKQPGQEEFYKKQAQDAQSELADLKADLTKAKPQAGLPQPGQYVEIKDLPNWGTNWRKSIVEVFSSYLDSDGKIENSFFIKNSSYRLNRQNLGVNWRHCSQEKPKELKTFEDLKVGDVIQTNEIIGDNRFNFVDSRVKAISLEDEYFIATDLEGSSKNCPFKFGKDEENKRWNFKD